MSERTGNGSSSDSRTNRPAIALMKHATLFCLLTTAVLSTCGCFGIVRDHETRKNLLDGPGASRSGVAVKVTSYNLAIPGKDPVAMDKEPLVAKLAERGWRTQSDETGKGYSVAIEHANMGVRLPTYGWMITYDVLAALPSLVPPTPLISRMDRCVVISVRDETGRELARRWTVVDHKMVALSVWGTIGWIGLMNRNINQYTAVLTTQLLNDVLPGNEGGVADTASP